MLSPGGAPVFIVVKDLQKRNFFFHDLFWAQNEMLFLQIWMNILNTPVASFCQEALRNADSNICKFQL